MADLRGFRAAILGMLEGSRWNGRHIALKRNAFPKPCASLQSSRAGLVATTRPSASDRPRDGGDAPIAAATFATMLALERVGIWIGISRGRA
jgi:hypothetical protein